MSPMMNDRPDISASATAEAAAAATGDGAAADGYCQDEREELARLLKSAARRRPGDIAQMRQSAQQALAAEDSVAQDLDPDQDVEAAQGQSQDQEAAQLKARLQSCTAVHRYIHAAPYHDDQSQPRSQQWRGVLARFKGLADRELNDWLALQIDVAASIERGIPDYRPRKDGPTFLILLEFVANQKRKALAVMHWYEGAHGGE